MTAERCWNGCVLDMGHSGRCVYRTWILGHETNEFIDPDGNQLAIIDHEDMEELLMVLNNLEANQRPTVPCEHIFSEMYDGSLRIATQPNHGWCSGCGAFKAEGKVYLPFAAPRESR